MGLGEPRHASPLGMDASVTLDEIATDAFLGHVTDLLLRLKMNTDNIVATARWKCGALMYHSLSYGMAAANIEPIQVAAPYIEETAWRGCLFHC